MRTDKSKLLVTGVPGVGKTTLIRKLAHELEALHPVGFYTAEIREGGTRRGFDLVSFSGERQALSHVDLHSPFRVARYGVDIPGFDRFLETIPFLDPQTKVVVIDEIGKMECQSKKFNALVQEIMGSDKIVIATVAVRGGGKIADVKKISGARLFTVTKANRNTIGVEILGAIDYGRLE